MTEKYGDYLTDEERAEFGQEQEQDEQPGQQKEATPKKALKFVCMADVQPEQVRWLWEPYIPKGKITLLEGDPAAGKTFIALAVAAVVSTGGPFPNSETGRVIGRRDPGSVIYLSAEDGTADTLRPRLDMVGADPKRVYAITGTVEDEKEGIFSFDDLALLDVMADTIKPELIVIDPLQAYLGASVDMHRANETRPVLSRLAALAERHCCAVLCIRHLSKASTSKSIYRGMGSIDFTAAARSVLLAGSDPQEPKTRAIAHIKSSLAPAGASQGYELGDGFLWMGISHLTAAGMLASEEPVKKEKTKEAVSWLKDILKNGPVEKREVENMAEDEEILSMTLRRAREKLGVVSRKRPGEKNGPWLWELPSKFMENDDLFNGQHVEDAQGHKMSNTSTREKSSNDRGSTCCSGKNGEQDVEASNGAENQRLDDLLNLFPKSEQPEEQPNEQGEGINSTGKDGELWEVNLDDI